MINGLVQRANKLDNEYKSKKCNDNPSREDCVKLRRRMKLISERLEEAKQEAKDYARGLRPVVKDVGLLPLLYDLYLSITGSDGF